MTKETLVFLGGLLLVVLPWLGIPEIWRQYGIVGVGVLFIFVGYALRRKVYLQKLDRGNGERGSDSFIETTADLFQSSESK